MNNIKNTSLSLVIIAIISIVALWIIGYGANINFRGYHGGGHLFMGTGLGLGLTATISTLLLLLIKVLFFLFIVGLIVGIAISVKRLVFTEEDIKKIKSTFTGKEALVTKETCITCAKVIEAEWKACPHCGTLKEQKVTTEA